MENFTLRISYFFSAILLFCFGLHSQPTEYAEYSYTEFFDLISEEKDSVFRMSDALISYNDATDAEFRMNVNNYADDLHAKGSRTNQLVVDKQIVLDNVHFKTSWTRQTDGLHGVLNNILFTEDVTINNVINIYLLNCEFRGRLISRSNDKIINSAEELDDNLSLNQVWFCISNSKLYKGASVTNLQLGEETDFRIGFDGNEIWSDSTLNSYYAFSVVGRNLFQMWMNNNKFYGSGPFSFRSIENELIEIKENEFEGNPSIHISGNRGFNDVTIMNNEFTQFVYVDIDRLDPHYLISYDQFDNRIIAGNVWDKYTIEEEIITPDGFTNAYKLPDSIIVSFQNRYIIENPRGHLGDKAFRSLFYNYFKTKFDTESANLVYKEIKDLETQRLAYLYRKDPSFDTYFTWKTNQFLKIFSEYGTRPANAIIFSIYVIMVFGVFYLFFPNSWDYQGRHLFIRRLNFFQKYLRQKEGMHDLYMEEKEQELSSYEDFKRQIDAGSLELPSFFVALSKPLYRISMTSTRLTARFLKGFDILEGRWQDLSPGQKRFKTLQIGVILFVGLIYDLFIKVMNAMMLSVNTFTTLGFGEIPIKGIPRYLAIIQGFIGWFMLTIFSVSLISQLLN